MKITAEYQVTEKRTRDFVVDDRIYREEDVKQQIANIILDYRMENLIKDLYVHDNCFVVEIAVNKINDAFRKADAIWELIE